MAHTIIQTKHMNEDVSSSSFSGSLEELIVDFEDTLGNQNITTIDELVKVLQESGDGFSYLLK